MSVVFNNEMDLLIIEICEMICSVQLCNKYDQLVLKVSKHTMKLNSNG